MNKFEVVEAIAEEYEITYDQAFDLVYDLSGIPTRRTTRFEEV